MPGQNRLSWALSALLVVALAGPALASDPELRGRFKGDEQWMLSVILSDTDQKAAFDKQAAEASTPAAKDAFEQRWRKRIVQFAEEYKRHLETTDIIPNAPTVEKMVNDWEFAITSHWLNHQPPERQKQVLSDISDGNAALGWFRGTVEKRIREKRKLAAADLAAYIGTPEAARSLAWTEPPPQTARRQLEQAEGSGRAAREAPTAEEATRRAGEVFAGTPKKPGDVTPPPSSGDAVTVPPQLPSRRAGDLVGLNPPSPSTPGSGLKIAPPPSPLVNRDAEPSKKRGPMGVLVKKFAPAAGGILGAILGFIFGGPVGALIGAAAGAALGIGAKKLVE